MKSALLAAAGALALWGAAPASAATYDFTLTPSGPALIGNTITGSGQFSTVFAGYLGGGGPGADSVEDIVSATGTVNGSAITGLDPLGVNVLIGENNGDPLFSVGFTTASGVTYDYDAGTVSSSNGDLGRDSFTLTPVSGVPLPASLPMMGAALLGLAAVGFGLKRAQAASA